MKIRFGTFNLYQFVEPPYSWYVKKDKFNTQDWETKKNWIKEQLENMNCDIIGFQEVFSNTALKELVEELGFKYFKTVDVPKTHQINKQVYTSTTVALASKYPITKIEKVKTNFLSLKKHHFDKKFRFSRIPIKAYVSLPNKQEILVYVCHLKSNRLNEFEYIFKKEDKLKDKKTIVEKALKEGYSESLKQRLCEASSLYLDIKKSKETPSVLMCDLNDREFSPTIDALTNKAYYYDIPKDNYFLIDAYKLHKKKIYNPHPEQKEPKRTPTSYYQGHGNVLDFIFVSNHFNINSKEAIAKVSDYEIFDRHLQENCHGSLKNSDHAQVVCEVEFQEL